VGISDGEEVVKAFDVWKKPLVSDWFWTRRRRVEDVCEDFVRIGHLGMCYLGFAFLQQNKS